MGCGDRVRMRGSVGDGGCNFIHSGVDPAIDMKTFIYGGVDKSEQSYRVGLGRTVLNAR